MKKELIEKIIDKYGIQAQSNIVMEECAELIQAISKCLRSKDIVPILVREHLIEEMADVSICLEQLKVMYSIDDYEIESWKMMKEDRLMKRAEL